ncbi:MAG: hypothetical protein ACYCZ0_01990 [Minisyncoccota bacterium]
MSVRADQMPNPDTAVERILLLETSNVGCSPHCTCRAQLALVMSDTQEARLRDHAAKVTFDKIPSDEGVVKKVLGDDIEDIEVALLDRMAEDRGIKTSDEIKGGRDNAQITLLNLMMLVRIPLQVPGMPGVSVLVI